MKNTNKYYFYLDKERSWWSYLTSNPKEFDEEDFAEGIYLYATATTIQELYKIMDEAGFDGEYIYYFIEQNLSHYDYNVLSGIALDQ